MTAASLSRRRAALAHRGEVLQVWSVGSSTIADIIQGESTWNVCFSF